MKILLLHNKYQLKGGEDAVVDNEFKLLERNGNKVEKLIFDNKNISSLLDKIKIGVTSIYNRNSGKILEERIISFKPDIIHVHNFFPIASPSVFWVASKLNVSILMTIHNYRLICVNGLLFRNEKVCKKCVNKSFATDGVIHSCYRNSRVQSLALALMIYINKRRRTWETKVDRYIALTSFSKSMIIGSSLKLQDNKIVVKPNFVDDHGYDYEKEDYFLFIGRLSVEKGVDLLLRVFTKNDKNLVIIGSGPLEGTVSEISKANQNITYLGYQENALIMSKLKKAWALLFSSICYEGMPMTILESFSSATPVIAPNIGGPNEMVNHNYNGLIFTVNDKNDLTDKINIISSDKDLHDKLCKGARKEYEEKYTPQENHQILATIYKDCIDGKEENY